VTLKRAKKSPVKQPGAMNKRAVKLGPRFQRAFIFANEKHDGQVRKASTIPYIAHLLGVASLVLEFGGDEDLAIAALLHDVVEDCGGMPMLADVKRRFGSRVAKIVEGCTDSFAEPKAPWRERKETYLRHCNACRRGNQAGFCGRQIEQCPLDSLRLPGRRRINLGTFQRWAGRNSLVLSGFAGGISSAKTESVDSGV
jgi:ribosome modulation factor